MSVETQRPMHQFDVVAFDVTFEMDYFHIPLMLRHGRVPIMAKDRTEFDPIVIAGGPCNLQSRTVCRLYRCFTIGEGEGIVSRVLDVIRDGQMEGVRSSYYFTPIGRCNWRVCTISICADL